MRRLYVDMDGVLADFDRAYEDRFGVHPSQHDDDLMWGNIDGFDDFFVTMPPCDGALQFMADVAHLNPIILTAAPKTNFVEAARRKRAWIRKHIGDSITVIPAYGGSNKPMYMHSPGDVLIDDFKRNTEAWSAAGGEPILHRNWAATRFALSRFDDFERRPIKAYARIGEFGQIADFALTPEKANRWRESGNTVITLIRES